VPKISTNESSTNNQSQTLLKSLTPICYLFLIIWLAWDRLCR